MSIKIQGTTIVDNSRQLQNIRDYVQVIDTDTSAMASYTYILIASLTLTLPATPIVGDYVKVTNSSGTTTAVIARNGSNIQSLAENMTIDVIDATFRLVYVDTIRGWVIS